MKHVEAWKKRLKRAAPLARELDFDELAAVVAEVRGNEPDEVIEALLDAIRAPEDHGAYEGLHVALWRFPARRLGKVLARRLPDLIRRMNKHDQVLRFVTPMFGEGVGRGALPSFLQSARMLPEKDRATLLRALRGWSKEHEDIEAVLDAISGKKATGRAEAAPLPPPPASWPREWQDALAKLRAGTAVTWKAGTLKELSKIVALLTQPLGKAWREAEALTNPLYISFAKKLWPDFVKAARELEDADRRMLLSQIARVDRGRAKRLQEGLASANEVPATPSRTQGRGAGEGRSPRRATGDATIERLRRICLALPGAEERVSHGEPTWFAGKGKVFAMLDNHHHGAEHLAVWLPMPPGAQAALVGAEPARYFRPPYVGPKGWVGVILDRRPNWRDVAALVRDAFVHVATKKLIARLEEEGAASKTLEAAPLTSKRRSGVRPSRRPRRSTRSKPATRKSRGS